MRRTSAPLLILVLLALALTANSSLAASRGAAVDVLLPVVENWFKYGETGGSLYGQSVASAGNTNGDLYDDVIIGSPLYDEGGEKIGAAYIYLGGGISVDPDTLPVKLTGAKGSNFGAAVASAGDVNNDGYDDVIVGAPYFKSGQGSYGAAYLYLGSVAGVQAAPAWNITGSLESEFGCAVAGVGDVNHDNYDDVLVGACTYNTTEASLTGAAYLYYGNSTGLQATPAWSTTGWQTGQRMGASVAGLGDLNHDGYADFIIGSPAYNVNVTTLLSAGAAFIWYGASVPDSYPAWTGYGTQWREFFGTSVAGAGDVDGNTYNDVIIGSVNFSSTFVKYTGAVSIFMNSGGMVASNPMRTYIGPDYGSGYGSIVAGLGDLNNDGYADVGVGAPNCDDLLNENNEGCVFVYSGSPYGLSPFATWVGRGGKKDAEYGMGLGGAGDVNGDGYGDLIIGAPRFMWDDKTPFGKVAVYHGGETEGALFYRSLLPLILR